MKISFFARVPTRDILTYNQFYAQDIRILRSISPDVHLAIRWDEIPWDADLYFTWWWTWALLPMAKARLRGRPTIVTGVFDLDDPMPGAWRDWPLWKRVPPTVALRLATANVFISELERCSVPRALTTRNPSYVPLVIDADAHPFSSAPREPFLLSIAWLAGDNPVRKGVDLALRAHALLRATRPELEMVVAGAPGDGLPALERLAEDLGTSARVRFVGRVDHEEKVRLLQTCACYMQPSVFEGFGVAAAEAMAAGAPVVACHAGTLPEVLGEAASYASERTPQAVADATTRALAEFTPERALAASRRITTRYSFEVRRSAMERIIRDATRGAT